MKMYVIGAAGMLGTYLVPYFRKKGHSVMATDIDIGNDNVDKFTDICDFHSLKKDLDIFQPDVIINLAAMTDLELCEINKLLATNTNAHGSMHCAQLAGKMAIPYIYISTAGIFDGKMEYYDDWCVPNPISVYAQSKYDGELAAQTVPKHIIMRCGWQMGSCEKDKKFVGKLVQQLKEGKKELHIVTDRAGTPTYVKDFTLQMEKLLEGQFFGVFNVVCQGEATRFDVGVQLIQLLGLENTIKIIPVHSDFYTQEYWAARPASEKLVTVKLNKLNINIMRTWQEALVEYVNENPAFFRVC